MRITGDAANISALIGTWAAPSAQHLGLPAGGAAPTLFGPDVMLAAGGQAGSTGYSPIPQPVLSPEEQERQNNTLKQIAALRSEKDFEGAQQLVDGLLAKNRNNPLAIHAAGVIQLDQGNNAEAQRLFEKAHIFGPAYGFNTDAENARILQGDRESIAAVAQRMLRNPAQRDQAQRLLVSQTKQDPTHTAARVMLADTLLQNGDATNALLQYQTAIATGSTEDLQSLRTRFASLVRQAPDAAFARNLYGQIQLKLGDHDAALETLKKARELGGDQYQYNRDLADAYVAVGRDALERGDERAALRHFEEALEFNDSGADVRRAYAEGLTARAEKLISLGDPSAAMLKLEKAREYLGDTEADDTLRGEMAAIAHSAGNRLQAARQATGDEIGDEVVAFQLAHELDPDQVAYRRALADVRTELGDIATAEGDLAAAAESYRAAYDLIDDDADIEQKVIDAYVAWGADRMDHWGYDDAIEAFEFAFDLSEDEGHKLQLAEAYVARGQMNITLEDEAQARADLEAALELFPDNEEWQALLDSLD